MEGSELLATLPAFPPANLKEIGFRSNPGLCTKFCDLKTNRCLIKLTAVPMEY